MAIWKINIKAELRETQMLLLTYFMIYILIICNYLKATTDFLYL